MRRSTFEEQVGNERFHYVLGDGRPLRFERRVAHAPEGREAAPRRDAGAAANGSCSTRPRDVERALALVARARLTVARELQFHNFLANPNPTGRSTADVRLRDGEAIRRADAGDAGRRDGSSTWPTFLAVALGVVGAGTLVVLWAHS